MPTYDYECNKCGHQFSVVLSVTEHEKKKVRCPKCKSEDLKHGVEEVYVTTSKKS